jgi:hypothetical protein
MRYLLTISLLLSAAAALAQTAQPCAYRDANRYWYTERSTGVTVLRDAGGERHWIEAGQTKDCFRTPIRDVENPLARIWGYRLLLQEWFKRLPWEAKRWDAPETVAVRQKVKELLGREFTSATELDEWYLANGDYLTWSAETKTLIVDENAKAQKRPITTRDPERELSAEEYWRYDALRFLRDVVDDGAYIRGRAWTGGVELTDIRFRILKTATLDRRAKEAGYRKGVETLIRKLEQTGIGKESSQEIRLALSRVTGQSFPDNRAWATWWRIHASSLHLDSNGTLLVTQ